MTRKDVQIGTTYAVKVSGKVQPVKIIGTNPNGGWNGRNTATGREIRIRTAAKLRGEWKRPRCGVCANCLAVAAAKPGIVARKSGLLLNSSESLAIQEEWNTFLSLHKCLNGAPVPPPPTETCAYYVTVEQLAGKEWTNSAPLPDLGTQVKIRFNNLGSGAVAGYFFEHGYSGVIVKLDNAPQWHVDQNSGKWHAGYAMVFGAEVTY